MKITPTLTLLGVLLLAACGRSEQGNVPLTAVPQVTTVAQSVATVQPIAPTTTLPALSPNPASRLQGTDVAMPYPNESFRIYGLGGLAASSTRTIEQYQQDVSNAITRNLAGRLEISESDVRVVQVQDTDVSACDSKSAAPLPDERTPGLEIIAESGGVSYRYVAAGALGYYCGEIQR